MRLFEFGTVYRYEKSGVVHGLTRVRGMTHHDVPGLRINAIGKRSVSWGGGPRPPPYFTCRALTLDLVRDLDR
jgi:hypothetical protein